MCFKVERIQGRGTGVEGCSGSDSVETHNLNLYCINLMYRVFNNTVESLFFLVFVVLKNLPGS